MHSHFISTLAQRSYGERRAEWFQCPNAYADRQLLTLVVLNGCRAATYPHTSPPHHQVTSLMANDPKVRSEIIKFRSWERKVGVRRGEEGRGAEKG